MPTERQLPAALVLLALGHTLLLVRARPWSDFYFEALWCGTILLLDWAAQRFRGVSPLRTSALPVLPLLLLSSAFWWLFEGYNAFLGNWQYLGGEIYGPLTYHLKASLAFSTVIPAVRSMAGLVGGPAALARPAAAAWRPGPGWLALALALALLPLLAPRWAYPLVWIGPFLVFDGLSARLGGPSLVAAWRAGRWQRAHWAWPLAALLCGLLWETWNAFGWPRWIYHIPPPFGLWPQLWAMPLPGYLGYLPFGLEVWAAEQLAATVWRRWRPTGVPGRQTARLEAG